MKSELELQKLVVDAVNGAGGFARKMNNRFLIGHSDLLVKLPEPLHQRFPMPAGFLETKQAPWPVKTSGKIEFPVEISVPQRRFLQAAHDAGMPCGVLSFLQRGTGRDWQCWVHVMPWVTYCNVLWSKYLYVQLPRDETERANMIMTTLYNWYDEWRRGL